MDFLILGPLELRDGAREVRLRGGKQRALLALLLLNANRTLAVDRIVDDLWGEDPPDSAHKMVQIYVAKLRKDLPPDTVQTRPPGYAIALEPGRLDLNRFEALVAEARGAPNAEQAADRFRAALSLWRGPALAEFASEPFAAPESARLEELHMAALEGRIEADLALGRHSDLVGELESLIARHPLRESLRRQHMLALYRSGRQAEALSAYKAAWSTLADELGIEPSPALRELERQILQQDSSLDVAAKPVPPAPAPPEEMLKLVTVLVAGVAGSTATARHPEDVRDLMAGYFAAMADQIRAEGGTVEQLAGHTIMAVFGVPAVREDDAVRAVRAARRIVDRQEGLEIRVGVSTGDVVVAGDLRVTGDAVNVAASLQHAAEPGTVLVAERTARAVRSRFALRPQAAGWRVESEQSAPTGTATPLVGRERELAVLRTTFDHVRLEGRPALVTVVGDAGVGKSRLVREFLADAPKALIGRCTSHGQGALAELLKAQAVILETDHPDAVRSKVTRLVEAAIGPDSARAAAALASTLGLAPPDGPSIDPRELHRELVGAWRALLASLARRGPVVVVVEDLHWADATTLDVVDEVAERLDGPILFLCTSRTRPDWGGGQLPLDPLSDEESARLAAYLPGVDELPDEVRRELLERAGGNPFFLEELVLHLIEGGSTIPDNVHAVILARLDLLTPDERRVAQRAAVVGRVFWDGVVARTAGVGDLEAALQTLRRREFVLERLSSSIPQHREYVFKHVLIRDVAYGSLTRAERGRAHATTAAWIEETSGDSAEVLAHHYDAAFANLGDQDLRRRARKHLLAGAANAHRRYAVSQGDQLASRAVELSEGAAERVEALEALGDLQYLAFLGDASWQTYGEALAELPDGDPVVARIAGKATLCAARFIGAMQDIPGVDTVRAVIDRGLRAAPPTGPERTQLLINRGFLIRQREKRDDVTAVREAIAAAEQLGDPDLLSAALDLAGNDEEQAGRHGEAYRISVRRLQLAPRLTDVTEIGDTYAVAAREALFVGRYREAEERASACVERARDLDSGPYLHGLTWLVAARFHLGDWDGALADHAELERVVALTERELPPAFSMAAYTRIALCHVVREQHDEADRYIALARRFIRERGLERTPGRSIHIPPLALALARQGHFDDALALVPYVPRSVNAGFTLEARCEIAAGRERWDEAPELVAAAREEASVGEQLSLPLYADRLEGLAAAAAGDTPKAAELLGRSADGFAAIGARWEEARSRRMLAEQY
jgi:DNA-binding SARP family transcriptional activator